MSTEKQDDFDLEYSQSVQDDTTKDKPDEAPADDVPEKFKGKTVKDVVQMYTNLESLSSRQANELGQYRKNVDQILGLRNDNTAKPPIKKPVTTAELLESPDKAISDAIDTSDAAKIARDALATVQDLRTDIAKNDFYGKYPKWKEDVENPAFLSFVGNNPLRSSLAQQADKDFRAAQALWGLWDEHKQLVSATETTKATEERKAALKATRTVSNGSSAETVANKPVFSRAKLLDLQMRAERGDERAKMKWADPEFQRQRMQAYQEGRVK